MTDKTEPHVLILVEGGALSDRAVGAATRYWVRAIERLQQEGFKVTYGSLRNHGPVHDLLHAAGCQTFALNAGSSGTYAISAMKLRSLARRLSVDVIHASEWIPAAVAGTAKPRGIKTIFHRHHGVSVGPERFFSRVAGHTTHLTMAVSRAAAEAALMERVRRERVRVTPNGIDPLRNVETWEIDQLRSELRIGKEARVVLSVGHLRPDKGHSVLLQAFNDLEIGSRVELVLVGSGPERARLESEAAALNTRNRIHFVGHQDDVAPWYALGDVTAIPSLRESFGLAAVEALSASCPVVAARSEGLVEIIEDGRSGLTVEPGNATALAEALRRILQDQALCETLAVAGRLRFEERFTAESMVRGWISCYRELL